LAHDVPRFTLPVGGGDATSCYKSLHDDNVAGVRRLALVYMVAAGGGCRLDEICLMRMGLWDMRLGV
jgi:hypothetical protein